MSDEKKPVIAQDKPYVMEMEPGTYWWCSCGKSEKQPFCDGAHKEDGCFSPVKVEIEEKRKVAWCGCKYSKKECPAFCDGTHSKL